MSFFPNAIKLGVVAVAAAALVLTVSACNDGVKSSVPSINSAPATGQSRMLAEQYGARVGITFEQGKEYLPHDLRLVSNPYELTMFTFEPQCVAHLNGWTQEQLEEVAELLGTPELNQHVQDVQTQGINWTQVQRDSFAEWQASLAHDKDGNEDLDNCRMWARAKNSLEVQRGY